MVNGLTRLFNIVINNHLTQTACFQPLKVNLKYLLNQ